MRIPIRHIAGHLLWSSEGHVWALYRLHPEPGEDGHSTEAVSGAYQAEAVREEQLQRITQLVRSLSGQPRLFGVCAQVDPSEIAWRMLDGLHDDKGDLQAGARPWLEHVEAALDVLDGAEMHRRTLWLAVPMSQESKGHRGLVASGLGVGAFGELSDSLGLTPEPVSDTDLARAQETARQVEAQIAGAVPFRRATPAEIVWLVQHALHRGIREPLLAEASTSALYASRVRDGLLVSPSYADLGQVRLEEGGRPYPATEQKERQGGWQRALRGLRRARGGKLTARQWWKESVSPLQRRWLQVETPDGTGYQAQLALAEAPPAVSVQAADLFAQLEVLDFPVDFTVSLSLVESEEARRKIQRKRTELVDQVDQYDARPTGVPSDIPEAARDLGEMDGRLAHNSSEVEVQSVTVLTVWAPTAELCDARARALEKLLSGANYRLVRPVGRQQELFVLGLPGSVQPLSLWEFTQHQLAEDWAACGAFTRTEAGDPGGMLLGQDLDCGTTRPVMINVSDAPQHDASASLAVVGDLGGGKSVLEKMVESATIDRGGRAICIDRTPGREWARFARGSARGRCQIIDAARAEISIDPLRVFPGIKGSQYALNYLTLQLGVGSMSLQGEVLYHAVEQAAQGPEPSMAKVVECLGRIATSGEGARADAATSMAGMLRLVTTNPLAAMVFDPALPVARLDGDATADLIVITTTGLTLPPKEAFEKPEILAHQPLEALIGRAVLYLIAAMARQAAFSDPSRFCAVVTDELYWLTSSAEGTALVHEILHDGRKHNAGLAAGAHDAKELGPDRNLFAYKALSRTTDRDSVRRGLDFIGLDSNDDALVRTVTDFSPVGVAERAGEMFLTGPRNNTGRIKVRIPAVPRIDKHIRTTPGDKQRPQTGTSLSKQEVSS